MELNAALQDGESIARISVPDESWNLKQIAGLLRKKAPYIEEGSARWQRMPAKS